MVDSLPSTSTVSPQIELKCGFWFGKLSTQWWEGPSLADTGKYGQKQLMDSANNVGLEYWMRYARYIDITNETTTDLIPGRTPRQ